MLTLEIGDLIVWNPENEEGKEIGLVFGEISNLSKNNLIFVKWIGKGNKSYNHSYTMGHILTWEEESHHVKKKKKDLS